jgi:hypothetical protein
MHASVREEIACRLLGSTVSVEVPDSLAGHVRTALSRLTALVGAAATAAGLSGVPADAGGSIALRVAAAAEGWAVESPSRHTSATTEEEAILRLQEMLIESATARTGVHLLFRGSIVARGSQSLLIVGDHGSTHALVGLALTSLGFRLVSVGTAAFEARTLVPLPLPIAFALETEHQRALAVAGLSLPTHLERLSDRVFCPQAVGAAPEPTHVLFPELHTGGLSWARPVAAAAARSRLYHAMLSAPADVSPFAAVASLLRHTRGIHLTMGDLSQALEQLGRLLPRWSMD